MSWQKRKKKLPSGPRKPGCAASVEDPGAGGDSEVEHDLLRLAAPRSMLVRKRRRHGPCRRQALLALLALGCVLLMLGALHPPPHALPRAPPAPQAAGRSPQAGYRLDFGDPQEWLLESEEEDREYDRLPPLVSLREDQLLVAVASPRAGRNRSRGGRGGGYRLIPRPQKQQNPAAPERDWAAEEEDEEDGEASEEGERTALNREEAPSARSPPHSGGSRHPL